MKNGAPCKGQAIGAQSGRNGWTGCAPKYRAYTVQRAALKVEENAGDYCGTFMKRAHGNRADSAIMGARMYSATKAQGARLIHYYSPTSEHLRWDLWVE